MRYENYGAARFASAMAKPQGYGVEGVEEFSSPEAMSEARMTFIRRTYVHVAGSLVVVALLLTALVQFVPGEVMLKIFVGMPGGWLAVLALFMGASFLSQVLAMPDRPLGVQYAGLGLMIAAYAFLFWPLIWMLDKEGAHGLIFQAAMLTLALAGGLTIGVFTTKKDFSFLGPIVSTGALVAMALIICAIFFGLTIGTWFTLGMIALMCGFILYETSQILHHWRTDGYVVASMQIFASVMTLFWYILRLYMRSSD
ncbi:MAG TPA: Bax inhibitor-1 family protein [Gemmatales bacterium]|nr:Bax inhibitor-1 family protein [Gemmatales bacterium]